MRQPMPRPLASCSRLSCSDWTLQTPHAAGASQRTLRGPPVDRRRSFVVGCASSSGTPHCGTTEYSSKIMQKIHGDHPIGGKGRGRCAPTSTSYWVLSTARSGLSPPAPHLVPRTKYFVSAQRATSHGWSGTLPPQPIERGTIPQRRIQTSSPAGDHLHFTLSSEHFALVFRLRMTCTTCSLRT